MLGEKINKNTRTLGAGDYPAPVLDSLSCLTTPTRPWVVGDHRPTKFERQSLKDRRRG